MGTPDFAKPTLEALFQSEHELAGIFTQPDQPKGRGRVLSPSPVKNFALSHNIPLYQPHSLKEEGVFEALCSLSPDIIIVVAYGQLLPEIFLNYPEFKCVNLHASLLPKYRGAAPINWALIRGESETGITTMLMDKGLDTGDVLLSESVSISSEDNCMTLHDKLAILGAQKILETIDALKNKQVTPVKQDHEQATVAPKLKKKDGLISWDSSAEDIFSLVRGTYKWPGAYTFFQNKRLKILKAELPEKMRAGKPGSILETLKKGIEVAVRDGSLFITMVQPEGKPEMEAYRYSIGHSINKGDCFKDEQV